MEYEEERITRLMAEAENALLTIHELAELDEEEFLRNKHYISSAKYNLLVAIEACIDIAYHLISKNKLRLPRDYADSFRVLQENGIVDSELAHRLILMARFRNRLVHIYWDVDNRMIYRIITESITDIEKFLAHIRKILREVR
ncbi:type VII toxin-antitoxin system HepT family RNase toxin [Palaeococcus ferrophilus]|uniref:type VII toxin-antitoxin system HepT family RNase toxin n=1 Tax=Palaeococcus ferrophilus TaxID=83868 RepID=UPI00064E6398|nr:DUF86 domain-containing protein [Palaeococcus ferrophilus]